MAKILVTPVAASGIKPFVVEGNLTSKFHDGELTYYIAGQSFPAEIAIVLKDESEVESA